MHHITTVAVTCYHLSAQGNMFWGQFPEIRVQHESCTFRRHLFKEGITDSTSFMKTPDNNTLYKNMYTISPIR